MLLRNACRRLGCILTKVLFRGCRPGYRSAAHVLRAGEEQSRDKDTRNRPMIKVKQVAHVCIFAHDLEKTRAFYEDVLGMSTQFNFLRDGKVFGFYLNCGGRSHVEVFQKDGTSYDDTDQINHFCLEVEKLDAAIEHIKSKGVEITKKKYACDDTYQAWIRDPNNVKIELFEYTDKSAQFVGRDRVADW
jgi:glyoxylase I family protein